MFFLFRRGATIGTEPRSPADQPAWSLETAFMDGNSPHNNRTHAIPSSRLVASWLLIERSSLSWEVLIDSSRRHTAKMLTCAFVRGVEDGVAFTSRTASCGIGTGRRGEIIQPTA